MDLTTLKGGEQTAPESIPAPERVPHGHSHGQTRSVLHRLSRALGHLESVKKMVEDGRDCAEVLIQLSAVRAALAAVSRIILKDHIEHCIVHAVEDGDMETLEELNRAIDQLLK